MTRSFTLSTFPTLTTDRLTLRAPRLSDDHDVLVFRGDFEVQKYNGPVFQTLEEARVLVEELLSEYAAREGICWAATMTGQDKVIGLFSIHSWNAYHRRAEVGYDLARTYWGQGIASEALRAILHFGFETLDLNRIYANTIADNHKSVRLLERLGFTREGTRRRHSWEEDGTFHDSAIYGLLRDEYTASIRHRDRTLT